MTSYSFFLWVTTLPSGQVKKLVAHQMVKPNNRIHLLEVS